MVSSYCIPSISYGAGNLADHPEVLINERKANRKRDGSAQIKSTFEFHEQRHKQCTAVAPASGCYGWTNYVKCIVRAQSSTLPWETASEPKILLQKYSEKKKVEKHQELANHCSSLSKFIFLKMTLRGRKCPLYYIIYIILYYILHFQDKHFMKIQSTISS